MYNLPYFKEEDEKEVLRFMREHPFIMLCGSDGKGRPVATQVPILMREDNTRLIIEGHVMRNTDHHKAFEQNAQALAVFTGAHTYVSASWYSDQKQASTWNYLSVHARGTIRFVDEAHLRRILDDTTSKYENNEQSPSLYKHLSKDYIDRLIGAIVGFELTVESIDNVFKLSQNRDEKSFHTIMDNLNTQDKDGKQMASEMERIRQGVFGGRRENREA